MGQQDLKKISMSILVLFKPVGKCICHKTVYDSLL